MEKARCYLCGKEVNYPKRQSKNRTHINIYHEPKQKRFCSHDCKEKWIFLIAGKKKHVFGLRDIRSKRKIEVMVKEADKNIKERY